LLSNGCYRWTENPMPRRLRFPDIPPGPHQELLIFLHELHRLAGEPSTREIAEGIVTASNGEVRCSHTTVHALLAGRKLPTKGDLLFELVKFLHSRNRHQRKTEDAVLDELDALWGPATRRHLLALPTPPPASGDVTLPAGVAGRPDIVPPRDGDPADLPRTTPAPQADGLVQDSAPGGTGTVYAAQNANVIVRPPGSTLVLDRPDEALRPAALPDLRTSRAVLAGVSWYQDSALIGLPAIPQGVGQLSQLLQRPSGAFLGENVTTLADPSARDLFESVERASQDAGDTLLFYYAGHGLVSPSRGELLLGTPETKLGSDYTSASYDTIRNLISSSRARRSVVILDCCFSGRALETMGPLDSLAEIPAAYVITSTSRNRVSFAPSGSQYTAFTGALIKVLQEGIPDGGEVLSISDIYEQLRDTAIEQGFPVPELRAHNDQGLALARNPAYALPSSSTQPADRAALSGLRARADAGDGTPRDC
jgi:hypothetical protein